MRNYGTLSLTVTSPPQSFEEPLTVAQVQSYLKLPLRNPVDVEEEAELAGFITAAREQAEIKQNRDLVLKQYDLTLDCFPCCNEIQLRIPLVSVDLFRYRDSTGGYIGMVDGTDHIADLPRGLVTLPYNGSWPSPTLWPSSALLIRFTSGLSSSDAYWSHSGARVLVGMKMLISHWYNGRLPFVTGFSQAVEMPYSVSELLGSGRNPRAY